MLAHSVVVYPALASAGEGTCQNRDATAISDGSDAALSRHVVRVSCIHTRGATILAYNWEESSAGCADTFRVED